MEETEDSRYTYLNELDKSGFQHDIRWKRKYNEKIVQTKIPKKALKELLYLCTKPLHLMELQWAPR